MVFDYQDFSNQCRRLRTNRNIIKDNYGICEPTLCTSYIYHVIFTKLSQNDQFSNLLVYDYYNALVRWIRRYIVFQMSVMRSVCRQICFQKITREHLSRHYGNLTWRFLLTSRWAKGQGQGPRRREHIVAPLSVSPSVHCIFFLSRWLRVQCTITLTLQFFFFWSCCPLLFCIINFCPEHNSFTIRAVNVKIYRWMNIIE